MARFVVTFSEFDSITHNFRGMKAIKVQQRNLVFLSCSLLMIFVLNKADKTEPFNRTSVRILNRDLKHFQNVYLVEMKFGKIFWSFTLVAKKCTLDLQFYFLIKCLSLFFFYCSITIIKIFYLYGVPVVKIVIKLLRL